MSERPPDPAAALARLARVRLRRRFEALDLRLRIELLALALLIGGFLFWQARMRFASIAADRGPWAAGADCALSLALLAVAGSALVGMRHVRRLREGGGLPWLSLPIPAALVHRHLARDSHAHALWNAVPAIAVTLAAIGIVPLGPLALLVLGFEGLMLAGTRVACRLALARVAHASGARPGLDSATRVLAVAARVPPATRTAATRWRREAPWRALLRKDLLVTLRPGLPRARLATPLLLGALSLLAWTLPLEPPLARAVAFALALLAAAGAAEWIVALVGSDPFSVIRGLPLGVGVVWGTRALWAAAVSLALAAGHGLAARSLAGPALDLFLAWLAAAALVVGVLGANYGITLFPRADHARRLLALSLGLAVAASLMIPLLGWIVLLTALLHSARRLPRWNRLEAR